MHSSHRPQNYASSTPDYVFHFHPKLFTTHKNLKAKKKKSLMHSNGCKFKSPNNHKSRFIIPVINHSQNSTLYPDF